MGFMLAIDKTIDKNIVLCVYKDEQYALDMFEYFKSWNYNKGEDLDNNICLSFIIENYSQYSVHIYPNLFRKTVNEFFKKVEAINLLEKYGKQHQQLVFYINFCNIFPYGINSQLKQFRNLQGTESFIFTTGFIDKDGGIVIVSDSEILKHHYKIKDRRDVSIGEIEYGKPKELFQ